MSALVKNNLNSEWHLTHDPEDENNLKNHNQWNADKETGMFGFVMEAIHP